MVETNCKKYPTKTLYEAQTVFRATRTNVVTEVFPVSPTVQTLVVTTQVCRTQEDGDIDCRPRTRTSRNVLPGSFGTRTRTRTQGNTRVTTTPTGTLYATTCSEPTDLPSSSHSPNLTSTDTKTLANTDTGSGSDSPGKLKVGAIVGGLLGGFLTPILLVFLFRYIIKRRKIKRAAADPPPLLPSALGPPAFRPTSPSATLHRSFTSSTGNHAPVLMDPNALDRRTSRTSRASDGRHRPSPSSSSHGHESGIYYSSTNASPARRPSSSSHGHDSGIYYSPANAPPVRRPTPLYGPQSHPPVAYPRAASPVQVPSTLIRSPSPVHSYYGTPYAISPEQRRMISPTSTGGPVINPVLVHSRSQTFDIRGRMSPTPIPLSMRQQDLTPIHIAGAPLSIVNESSPISRASSQQYTIMGSTMAATNSPQSQTTPMLPTERTGNTPEHSTTS